ncbi:proline-rich transmembrane protein 1-like [Myxocyprinus asiaticus]|uniref:proline-rich transmembrane protein 1-like n=1 Tax=Myxocyprinus asiaticus TaxID=70543 RepID=UPI002222DDEB|nr:proline-rich transmembrane protein 1-like [Myxocyprinus asiaticus]
MDPSKSFNDPSADWNVTEKTGLLQPLSPPYLDHAEHPNAGYPPPGSYPSTSGYQGQQYGAPAGMYGQGLYPGQPVVTVQPTLYVTTTPLANPLPDYMGYSIFTMLCCCLPLGIIALVYSINTRNANMAGHQLMAVKNSRMARIFNHTALGIGLALFVLYIIYITVVVVNAGNHDSP